MAIGRKTGGRQKGSKNKVSGELKSMILGALNGAGGEAYLLEQAKNNPNAFLSLIGKVLPMTVAGDEDNPLQLHVTAIERRIVDGPNAGD